jgi:hypothetical protein
MTARTRRVLVLLTASMALCAIAVAAQPRRPDLDTRLPEDERSRGGFTMRMQTLDQQRVAERLARIEPGLTLRWNGLSGSPKWIAARPERTLSTPSGTTPEERARGWMRGNASLFGLDPEEIDALRTIVRAPAQGGGAHVRFKQIAQGLEVFGGGANVNLSESGSVRSVGSELYGGVRGSVNPLIGPTDAIRLASADVYPEIPFTGRVIDEDRGTAHRTTFADAGFGLTPEAQLVWFPRKHDALLAWQVFIAEPTLESWYLVLVDAGLGDVLYRQNLVEDASARVLQVGQPSPESEEFAPVQYVLSTIPALTPQSPAGWITGGGTSLTGNNATGQLDFWDAPVLSDPGSLYDYPFGTSQGALANAWWWANEMHDRFHAVGFNEAAGNLQVDNFGLGGVGGDPMHVVSWTSGLRNNAFFLPSVDGGFSTLNLGINACRICGDHDGYPENGGDRRNAFGRDVTAHEYSHALPHRFVGDFTCFSQAQSDGMGEGWADLFAASFFEDPKLGRYFMPGLGWIRDVRHDLDYADVCLVSDFGCEAHSEGMIWAGTLWELRQSMIALDPVGGLDAFNRLIVEGIANTVCHPDMVDARDGILAADTSLFASVHFRPIWNVFASRGMGKGAASMGDSDRTPKATFIVPSAYACTPPAAPTTVVASPAGSNAVQLTYAAPGASSLEIWREDLDNPLDRPARIAYTTNPTTFVDGSVQGGKSYRYHVVALGNGGTVCRSAVSATASATATGSCSDPYPVFDPGATVTYGTLDCALTLGWTAASPACPGSGAPISYSVYRGSDPGFEPADRFLIGRTAATSFQDEPPQDGKTYYYLVLAQNGAPTDPPDHQDRGSAQALRWVPAIPTLARTTSQFWDFESGPSGWTSNSTSAISGAWMLVTPHPTRYAGAWLAPPAAAGGSGMAWVTGDDAAASVTSHDCDGYNNLRLASPVFDGTGGRTLLSFDYWVHVPGRELDGLNVEVTNGVQTVSVRPIRMMTVQAFDTDTDRGWQRAELDLAGLVAPTSTMRVTFVPTPGEPLSEFGIDNVRVEQATLCGRSGLQIVSVGVDDSAGVGGNGNGFLEPGETAHLLVQVTNAGSVPATSPGGTLSTLTSGVTVLAPSDTFPTLAPAASGSSSGTGFTVLVSSTLACGGTIVLEFTFTDGSGTTSKATWNLETGRTVTETIFEDTFATDQGWTVSGTPGKGIWQRGDPVGTVFHGDQANPEIDSPNDADALCYVTENGSPGGNPNATDVDEVNGLYSTLSSPLLDLSPYKRVHLSFDLWFYKDPAEFNDDALWSLGIDDPNFGFGFSALIFNTTNGWTTVLANPDVPLRPNARVRFTGIDGSHNSLVEMGVDNVRVLGDKRVCDPP